MKRLLLFGAIALSINSFGQVPNYVPTNGLVSYWGFNGNANDESGNGNNGTVNGATLTTDRFGSANSAYYFSSAGCGTRIDANVNTSTIQTGLTISIWVCKIGSGCIGPRLFEFYPGSDGPGIAQWGWDNTDVGIGLGSITSTGFSCDFGVQIKPLNTWTHLVYTNDGTNGKFYQDGVLMGTVASSGNPILASSLAIGRMNHPSYDAFNGKLDDMGVWNRALTQCEISELYHAQQFTPPVLTLSDTTSACGASTTLDAGTDPSWASYLWNTAEDTQTISVSNSGLYTVEVTDTNGCIGYDTTLVSLLQPTSSSITETVCDTYMAPDGATYTSTGNYTAVIPNAAGCDSTINIDLTITNSNTGSETVTECDSYTWNTNGQTYTQSGQFTSLLTNQSGCDSTVTLNLTITNSNTGSETVTECDSYTWNTNGQTYTQSGQYTEVLTNQVGCDSTVTLNLTINSSSSSTQTDSGVDSYTWSVNNQTYTQSGTYTAVVPNASGCDSTITLDLTLQFTGLDENESSYVAVYPNPTYSSFTLSTKDMIHMNYTLLDIQGKVVLTGKIESTEQTVDISKLSKGQYNLVFEDESISPISIIKN
ncbi:MAG: hypothetical protein RIT43_2198 [Bacteroidota bacterium]|jgi:hypothetical protein